MVTNYVMERTTMWSPIIGQCFDTMIVASSDKQWLQWPMGILVLETSVLSHLSYDVTSSRPGKTTIAFFANFGGIEKLFCAPDLSLNSKIMNQCNIDFNFLE